MQVAIVKYNAGNVFSVINALKRLDVDPILTDNPEELQKADRVLFPGQGEARGAMEYLKARRLDEVILSLKQPVFGICVGQQLLCRHSEEGDVDCLGVFDVDVKRFSPISHQDKVPCMGWNQLIHTKGDLYVEHSYAYFVHSYYVPVCAHTTAVAEHILPYSAALQKDNFYACQFHPEKSGQVGEDIIKKFLEI